MFAIRFVFAVRLISFCFSAPNSVNNEDITEAIKFMKKYGYINSDNNGVNNLESFSDKIKSVQRMGAIEETGVLDEATKKLMNQPRCGNSDLKLHKRNKRYVLTYGFGWEKRKITFYLENWSPSLGEHEVATNIDKALNTWGKYGRLIFTRSQDPNADIIVKFASLNHGDRWPFDGPGSILAHAFAPNGEGTGGDIHFDADERWVNKDPHEPLKFREFDFYSVALHELGHSMGLSHSNDPSAVMFAYYRGATELNHDDALGMWALYINRTLTEDTNIYDVPTVKSTTESEEPRGRPNYATTVLGNENRRIHGRFYIPTTEPTIRPSTESEVSRWHSRRKPENENRRILGRKLDLPKTNININFHNDRFNHNVNTFTKPYGNYFNRNWRLRYNTKTYNNNNERYKETENTDAVVVNKSFYTPKVIQNGYPNIRRYNSVQENNTVKLNKTTNSESICEGDIDAATMWRGKLFVFKGEYIWSFEKQRQLVGGFPLKLVDMFPVLPKTVKKIDAAYERQDDVLVLFSGTNLWEYDGTQFLHNNPKSLAHYGLPTYLTNLDAALSSPFNNEFARTFFFKDNKFWAYNEVWQSLDSLLPETIEFFQNVPPYLDAATVGFNGKITFFKGKLFWEYDGISATSPMDFSEIWFGCPNLLNGVSSKSNNFLLSTSAIMLLHIYKIVIK